MILIKSRVLLSTIFSVIGAIVKTVYKILKIFHVRFLVLMALLGIIFYYTEVFKNYEKITVGYGVILAVYFLFLIIKGYKKISKKQKGDKRNSSVQTISQSQEESQIEEVQTQVEVVEKPKIKYPVYYSVKQSANHVMAEYEDRYELFQKTSMGLKRVRVDYKEQTNDVIL